MKECYLKKPKKFSLHTRKWRYLGNVYDKGDGPHDKEVKEMDELRGKKDKEKVDDV